MRDDVYIRMLDRRAQRALERLRAKDARRKARLLAKQERRQARAKASAENKRLRLEEAAYQKHKRDYAAFLEKARLKRERESQKRKPKGKKYWIKFRERVKVSPAIDMTESHSYSDGKGFNLETSFKRSFHREYSYLVDHISSDRLPHDCYHHKVETYPVGISFSLKHKINPATSGRWNNVMLLTSDFSKGFEPEEVLTLLDGSMPASSINNKNDFSLLNFLAELDEIPKMLKGFSSAADLFLAGQFGIKPLMADAFGLAERARKKFENLNEQKRHVTSGLEFSEWQPFRKRRNVQFVRNFDESNWSLPDGIQITKSVQTGFESLTGEFRYRYVLPPSLNDFLRVLDGIGLYFNPSVVWNAIPFSFLVDYVLPIGKFLKDVGPGEDPWLKPEIEFRGVQRAKKIVAHVDVSFKGTISSDYENLPLTHIGNFKSSIYRRVNSGVGADAEALKGRTPSSSQVVNAVALAQANWAPDILNIGKTIDYLRKNDPPRLRSRGFW